ncbi:MAG: peptidase M3, partial [Burkholderiaceae bacterium]
MNNPLLGDWSGNPFGLPPFDAIEPGHFAPAFEVAMRKHLAEIDAIAHNPEPPSFENTVAAFDRAGALYSRIEAVFWNLVASVSTPELQAAQRELAAPLATHENAIRLHAALFARIDALHARIDT